MIPACADRVSTGTRACPGQGVRAVRDRGLAVIEVDTEPGGQVTVWVMAEGPKARPCRGTFSKAWFALANAGRCSSGVSHPTVS